MYKTNIYVCVCVRFFFNLLFVKSRNEIYDKLAKATVSGMEFMKDYRPYSFVDQKLTMVTMVTY